MTVALVVWLGVPVALAAGGWSITSSPDAPGSDSLDSVSCPSSTSCVAVGGDRPTGGVSRSLIERWSGRRWVVQGSPRIGALGDQLVSVACPTTRSCWAVGSMISHALIEHWGGARWGVLPTPRAAGPFLDGVACPSASFCVAVGGTGRRGVILTWNGRRWAPSPSPQRGIGTGLLSVSCSSNVACMAVGVGGDEQPLAERWTGSHWLATTTAPAHASPSQLAGVSCTAGGPCVAVGSDGPHRSFAERWNGLRWSAVPVPNPGASVATLTGISCSASTSCVAVGYAADAGLSFAAVVALWNGHAWHVASAPRAGSSILNGVDVTPTLDVAVGSRGDAAAAQRTLIERAG